MAGPHAEVPLTGDRVDWEVEQVIVIGREAQGVSACSRLGFRGGNDGRDRTYPIASCSSALDSGPVQPRASLPQNYGPIGPALVSLDEFADPDAIGLRCWVDGEPMQDSNTRNLIFPVPDAHRVHLPVTAYCALAI